MEKELFLNKTIFEKAWAVLINIMKVCSTDLESRLVSEIAWRHACLSTSPNWCHEMSCFKRLPHHPVMVTSLMDGPWCIMTVISGPCQITVLWLSCDVFCIFNYFLCNMTEGPFTLYLSVQMISMSTWFQSITWVISMILKLHDVVDCT